MLASADQVISEVVVEVTGLSEVTEELSDEDVQTDPLSHHVVLAQLLSGLMGVV